MSNRSLLPTRFHNTRALQSRREQMTRHSTRGRGGEGRGGAGVNVQDDTAAAPLRLRARGVLFVCLKQNTNTHFAQHALLSQVRTAPAALYPPHALAAMTKLVRQVSLNDEVLQAHEASLQGLGKHGRDSATQAMRTALAKVSAGAC